MMLVLIVTCGLLFVTVYSELVCPDGWHKHDDQCYWFSDFNTTRDDAKIECESRNGNLVTISTHNLNDFLQKRIFNNTNYWIGLKINGVTETNKWQWSSGETVAPLHYKFINWCSGHTIGTACAAATYGKGNPVPMCYESFSCGLEQRYACEKDKLSPGCPVNWVLDTVVEKCYFTSIEKKNIKDAASFCWRNGGRLITVKNTRDAGFLRNNEPGPNEHYWVGISPYRWDDGSAYNWHNWDSNGPSVGHHCTVIQHDGSWLNGVCLEALNNFICQKGATSAITVTTAPSTITPDETTTPEIALFTSSELPSTSSVSMISTYSTLPTVYVTNTPKAANGSSYTEMFWQDSTPTTHSKLAMNMMIGVYSAVGVVFVIFLGLLAQCLVLRKRHISRMKNMSIEQETQFSKIASHDLDGDDDCIYDSPEIVQIDNVEQSRRTSSDAAAHNTIITEVGPHVDNTNYSMTQEKSHGQETIAQTISSSTKTTASEDSIKDHGIINTEQTQLTVTDTASSSAGMAHTSVFPGHVLVNGEVYAEVDMSRKTIGYDDVILPQAVMNTNYEHSTNNEILSSTCNQDATGETDAENTSESIYYNESAQPIYSNDDSDHDLENLYNNAVPSDKCDTDNSLNDEETYANCGEETGGVAYTEVDLSEPTSNMPITEEESVVYSDIKM